VCILVAHELRQAAQGLRIWQLRMLKCVSTPLALELSASGQAELFTEARNERVEAVLLQQGLAGSRARDSVSDTTSIPRIVKKRRV
jgi:hypothetical protein